MGLTVSSKVMWRYPFVVIVISIVFLPDYDHGSTGVARQGVTQSVPLRVEAVRGASYLSLVEHKGFNNHRNIPPHSHCGRKGWGSFRIDRLCVVLITIKNYRQVVATPPAPASRVGLISVSQTITLENRRCKTIGTLPPPSPSWRPE